MLRTTERHSSIQNEALVVILSQQHGAMQGNMPVGHKLWQCCVLLYRHTQEEYAYDLVQGNQGISPATDFSGQHTVPFSYGGMCGIKGFCKEHVRIELCSFSFSSQV